MSFIFFFFWSCSIFEEAAKSDQGSGHQGFGFGESLPQSAGPEGHLPGLLRGRQGRSSLQLGVAHWRGEALASNSDTNKEKKSGRVSFTAVSRCSVAFLFEVSVLRPHRKLSPNWSSVSYEVLPESFSLNPQEGPILISQAIFRLHPKRQTGIGRFIRHNWISVCLR